MKSTFYHRLLLFLALGVTPFVGAAEKPQEKTQSVSSPAAEMQMHSFPDLKMRAMDYYQAFDMLRKEKTSAKVYFQLTDGSLISNIIDISLMTNGTLMLFRYNTNQGIKLQVVKVEEITSLNYF